MDTASTKLVRFAAYQHAEREVNRNWTVVKKALDREDADAEKAMGAATDNTTQPPTTNTRKRKSKFEKQAEDSAKRMRNNRSEKWEGWL